MRSWWLWCLARTSLCWWAPGECRGCVGSWPCCRVHPGPVIKGQQQPHDRKQKVFVLCLRLIDGSHETELTGKKILCGLLSFSDDFLKSPLDGFRNHMRWTPPFSSPSSSREGCSGRWRGETTQLELMAFRPKGTSQINSDPTWTSCQ